MITLEINVIHLVFRDEAKFLYFASGGKDIIHTTGMIVDPIIATIVTNQFSPFQVQGESAEYFCVSKSYM